MAEKGIDEKAYISFLSLWSSHIILRDGIKEWMEKSINCMHLHTWESFTAFFSLLHGWRTLSHHNLDLPFPNASIILPPTSQNIISAMGGSIFVPGLVLPHLLSVGCFLKINNNKISLFSLSQSITTIK